MSQLLLLWSLPLLVLSSPQAGTSNQGRTAGHTAAPAGTKDRSRPPARRRHRDARLPRSPSPGRPKARPHAPPAASARKEHRRRILAVVNLSAPLSRGQVRWSLQMYGLLRRVLGGRWPEQISPLEDFDLRALLAGDRPDWSLEQAKALLSAAKVAFATLKIQKALSHLEAAREILLRRVPVEQAKGPLAQVWAYMVLCRNSLGQADLARREASLLALVSPGGHPLPAVLWTRYRPAQERKPQNRRRKRQPKHLVRIQVPAGATVYIDFKKLDRPAQQEQGATRGAGRPSTTSPARHGRTTETSPQDQGRQRYSVLLSRPAFLAVEAAGKQHYFSTIQPRAQTVDVVLTPATEDRRADLREWLDAMRGHRPSASRVQALAEKVGASLFLIILGNDKGLGLTLLDPTRPASPLWSKTLAPGEPGAKGWPKITSRDIAGLKHILIPRKPRPTRAALAKTARKAAQRIAGKKSVPVKKPKKRPLWKKWYFWVVLGTVAVAATVFAVTKDRQSDQVDIRVSRP